MTRYMVLRLCNANKLAIKEPNAPCVLLCAPADPLSDAQLRRLVLAAPWSPVAIEGTLSNTQMVVDIESIEILPKPPQPPKPRRKCDAKKQHARMLSLL